MNVDLPPLNALHTFESAARHLSFKQAAAELHLTPSAVSKQIRQLEEHLGYRLFHRLTRHLVLTEEGKQLIIGVRTALTLIADRIESLQIDDVDQVLKLSVPPSFAMKWLIPRLSRFKASNPDIILNIDAEEKYVDLREVGIDVAIRYGKNETPSAYHSTPLMGEDLFPVCAPKLQEVGPPIHQVKDLCDHCLLHTPEKLRWPSWFEAVGHPGLHSEKEMFFSRADLAVQATIEGQGIMIARAALVGDDIAVGKLMRLFDFPVKDEKTYSLLCLKESRDKKKVSKFREWLLEEVGQIIGS